MTDKTIAFSLLNLAPFPKVLQARSISHSLDLARLAESAGYTSLPGWQKTPQYDVAMPVLPRRY
ncbi:hypothetical protein ACLK1T_16255 [Escherichia coli]